MKNKHAFTLPELLVVFVIMGVLIVISLYTINDRYTDFFTRYYSAYDALNKASYNTYTDTYCRANGISSDGLTDCQRDDSGTDGYMENGRPFPDTTQKLCKRLTEYLNATDENACATNKNSIINAQDDEFDSNSMQFELTNGLRFYFSSPKRITINHAGKKNKIINYYIVYIDLNGDAKPNKMSLPHPDIVPFIVTFTGDVIPVGYPIYDKTYASARIIDSYGKQTKSYTINEARQIAFGATPYTDIPLSMIPNFEAILPRTIKPSIVPTYQIGGDSANSMGCTEGTFICTVKIDENFEKRY
mgnify:CR=1 FL=1